MEPQRLQKWLAFCGYGSRRACEQLIQQGRVQVNGTTATLGTKVDPERDVITVDGVRVQARQSLVYLMLNKPRGYVTTRKDPHAPRTVMQLLKGAPKGVFPVGRLDADSEGLLLFTNDGDFANRLMHPRYKLPKTYRVWVRGKPSEKALNRLREGVLLEEGVTAPAIVRLIRAGSEQSLLEMVLREGRKRQIRRMCQAVGHPVQRLVRIAIGDLRLPRDLPPGKWRALTEEEYNALLRPFAEGATLTTPKRSPT
ncbi:MAG: pseudouridine synthase [Fimbriimonadales bacterium]|nr:MAG: pseudouridine synthase [Fimbriimonadales bacterium]